MHVVNTFSMQASCVCRSEKFGMLLRPVVIHYIPATTLTFVTTVGAFCMQQVPVLMQQTEGAQCQELRNFLSITRTGTLERHDDRQIEERAAAADPKIEHGGGLGGATLCALHTQHAMITVEQCSNKERNFDCMFEW